METDEEKIKKRKIEEVDSIKDKKKEKRNLKDYLLSKQSSNKQKDEFRKQYEYEDEMHLRCKKCKNKYTFNVLNEKITSSSNLRSHKCINNDNDNKNQPKINFNVITKERKDKLDKNLSKIIVMDERPFRLIKTESFKAFVNELNSSYSIPDEKTIKKNMKNQLEVFKLNLKEKIKNVECFSITADLRKSNTNCHFIGITLHYFDQKIIHRTLAMSPLDCVHATGAEISAVILKILAEFNLPADKIVVAVSDGGTNMKSAFSILKIPNFHCAVHQLNLIIQEGMTCINDLRSKCKTIARKFRKSSVFWETLKNFQKEDNIVNSWNDIVYKTPIEVKTRFNSSYYMIDRISLLLSNINATFAKLSESSLIVNDIEKTKIDEVLEIMKPFDVFFWRKFFDFLKLYFGNFQLQINFLFFKVLFAFFF